jgi:hypothetical protein
MQVTSKDTRQRRFINRHTHGLPKEKCTIEIITGYTNNEAIYLCEWLPFDKSENTETSMPAEGYLGTAKVIGGNYDGIGFHAWEQNNSEFVWYVLVYKGIYSKHLL